MPSCGCLDVFLHYSFKVYKWVAEKLDGQLDRNQEERVDGVSEELMGEGGQEGCRSSKR